MMMMMMIQAQRRGYWFQTNRATTTKVVHLVIARVAESLVAAPDDKENLVISVQILFPHFLFLNLPPV